MAVLLHVTTAEAWAVAERAGVHAPPELARDGFLHLCTEGQLAFVLERHFPVGAVERTRLVVLEVDAGATGARLEWVRSEPGMAPFPHLHGAIPVEAVRGVLAVA